MDFRLDAELETFRAEVRELLGEVVDAAARGRVRTTGTHHDERMAREMGARGWLRAVVPGIEGSDPLRLHVLFGEMERAAAPYDALASNLLVAGLIDQFGTPFHRREVFEPLVDGLASVCLGYSEPDAGSDVAAVTTRAVASDGRWVLNGRKLWTTMAHEARWGLVLARTDAAVPAHRGLTTFLVPMDSAGIEVRPVLTMGDDRVNAVYFDDVEVADEWRLGEVDGGWRVLMSGLALERGVIGNCQFGVPLLRAAVDCLRSQRDDEDRPLLEDPSVQETLASIAIDNQVGALLGLRAAVLACEEGGDGTAGSMVKVFVSERYVRAADRLRELSGPAALTGELDHHVRHSPVTRIAGGTTEINRNNIAERHLGLPRSR
jgi:3-oxocholest-4-en-26-oyl-CoA dehydrogenase alpha subunit